MSDKIYYCTQENNDCPKKEECKRYIELKDENRHTTLFKVACTEDNNYILFMKYEDGKTEEVKEEGENQ